MVNLLWTKPIHSVSNTPHIHLYRVFVAIWLIFHQTNPMSKEVYIEEKEKTGRPRDFNTVMAHLVRAARRARLSYRRSVLQCCCVSWWRFFLASFVPRCHWAMATSRCGSGMAVLWQVCIWLGREKEEEEKVKGGGGGDGRKGWYISMWMIGCGMAGVEYLWLVIGVVLLFPFWDFEGFLLWVVGNKMKGKEGKGVLYSVCIRCYMFGVNGY